MLRGFQALGHGSFRALAHGVSSRHFASVSDKRSDGPSTSHRTSQMVAELGKPKVLRNRSEVQRLLSQLDRAGFLGSIIFVCAAEAGTAKPPMLSAQV